MKKNAIAFLAFATLSLFSLGFTMVNGPEIKKVGNAVSADPAFQIHSNIVEPKEELILKSNKYLANWD